VSDLILKLALQAMTDDDAFPVLQDAIVELGQPGYAVADLSVTLGYLVTENIANNYASAVAATLLFRDWPTSWPLAQENWNRQHDRARTFEGLFDLYRNDLVSREELIRLLGSPLDRLAEKEGESR
jgi:hypothetical protein